MHVAAITEFPFMERLPKRERTRVGKLWDSLADLRRLRDEHGLLIPCGLAAELGGVCKQRISQLIDSGQLRTVELNGKPFVTEKSFVAWATSERANGVNIKIAGMEVPQGKWKLGNDFTGR